MELTNHFFNKTVFYYGCKSGNVELVKYLLSIYKKFDINSICINEIIYIYSLIIFF